MSEKTSIYRAFFIESPEGADFITKLKGIIDGEHQKAEAIDDPNVSFSHTQRAKGVREALSLISSLTTEAKKRTNNT